VSSLRTGSALSVCNPFAIRPFAPFTEPCGNAGACNMPKTIRLPPGNYFMLGDNRGASDDSRFWGPVPKQQILGKVE